MKTMILCVLFSFCLFSIANAQKARQSSTKHTKKAVVKKAVAKNTTKKSTAINKSVSVNNSNAYTPSTIRYRITDPVLLEMNRKPMVNCTA